MWPKQNSAKRHLTFHRRSFSNDRFGRFQIISILIPWNNSISVFLQLDVSQEYPDVLCASKLLFAPPNSHERIAGLAWQVSFLNALRQLQFCKPLTDWPPTDQNQISEGSSSELDETLLRNQISRNLHSQCHCSTWTSSVYSQRSQKRDVSWAIKRQWSVIFVDPEWGSGEQHCFFVIALFHLIAVCRNKSIQWFFEIDRPHCGRSTRRKGDNKLHCCRGKYLLFQATCRGYEILKCFHVIRFCVMFKTIILSTLSL